MKRFKFRLEKVLQIRESIKDERKRELMMANMQLTQAQDHLAELNAELLAAGVGNQETSSERLYLLERYRIRISEAIEAQSLKVEEAKQAVELALQNYLEAAKDAKSLQMLKDKRKQEYLEQVSKEEGQFLDEIATQRKARVSH